MPISVSQGISTLQNSVTSIEPWGCLKQPSGYLWYNHVTEIESICSSAMCILINDVVLMFPTACRKFFWIRDSSLPLNIYN